MLGEMKKFDTTWDVLSSQKAKIAGKQLYRLNHQEMIHRDQWAAYIVEELGLWLDWLDGRHGPI